MKRGFSLSVVAGLVAITLGHSQAVAASGSDPKGKTCTMEQQCHWENFKKVCTWVKVCR